MRGDVLDPAADIMIFPVLREGPREKTGKQTASSPMSFFHACIPFFERSEDFTRMGLSVVAGNCGSSGQRPVVTDW